MRSLVEVKHGSPDIVVGKDGLTDSVVREVVARLKKEQYIKVRFLSVVVDNSDKKVLASELASRSGAKLVSRVGFTVVLEYQARVPT
jgi:RNA-binding protein